MHLLPVAIKIFCASHVYVDNTFCSALSTVGDIGLLCLPYLIVGLGLGVSSQKPPS